MRRSAIDLYRVQSTFSTCLGLAEYIALAMPFALYFAVGSTHDGSFASPRLHRFRFWSM